MKMILYLFSHRALPLYSFPLPKLLSNPIGVIRGLLPLTFQIGYLVVIIPEGCV